MLPKEQIYNAREFLKKCQVRYEEKSLFKRLECEALGIILLAYAHTRSQSCSANFGPLKIRTYIAGNTKQLNIKGS